VELIDGLVGGAPTIWLKTHPSRCPS
jgi:hypothetical protein